MKLRLIILAAALIMTVTPTLNLSAQQAGGVFSKEFTPLLESARDYSVEMAGIMPEEHYGFKPTPEIMSFAEQIAHDASSIYWFAAKIKGEENPGKAFKLEGKTKAEIITYLKEAFAYALKVLSGLTDPQAAEKIPVWGDKVLTRSGIFMLMKDHTTHHRGQMVIYLRLKGLKPAEFRG